MSSPFMDQSRTDEIADMVPNGGPRQLGGLSNFGKGHHPSLLSSKHLNTNRRWKLISGFYKNPDCFFTSCLVFLTISCLQHKVPMTKNASKTTMAHDYLCSQMYGKLYGKNEMTKTTGFLKDATRNDFRRK
jgi:hypothetical protein